MSPTIKKHMAAIRAGYVERSNVIGMRKAINSVERIRAGWSANRSSATPADADALETALEHARPIVRGDLHDSGLTLLRGRRYAKRLTDWQSIIDELAYFRLIRFDRIGERGQHAVPVYLAIGESGAQFAFRNIPWQSGGDGPEIVRSEI